MGKNGSLTHKSFLDTLSLIGLKHDDHLDRAEAKLRYNQGPPLHPIILTTEQKIS
jgi:hypothetical protein